MADDIIEFDPVDAIGAGAFGSPGRAHVRDPGAQGRSALLSVLVEKEQVALLAAEAEQFLDRIDEEDPDSRAELLSVDDCGPGRGGRAAVPGPAHRDRVRPRSRSSC